MPVIYSPSYEIDIGSHVFPTVKYRLVCEALVTSGIVDRSDVIEPEPATWEDLALVHTAEYLAKMRSGSLSEEEIAQLELPWSAEIVEVYRRKVGGTIRAALIACGPEVSSSKLQGSSASDLASDFRLETSHFRAVCHIGGGLHHAFPNHGEGFCPFNDVAVAVRVLQSRGIERAAIVDLDVHQGNGTAFIFESDPRICTFSMHQQHNYPMWKPRSTIDIGLADGVHDAAYLGDLERALPQVMGGDPQCVFYLAGADPYEEDQLGGLRLTKDGLRRRDRMVIETVRAANVPLVVLLAGGYARNVQDTVAIHVATIEEALK